MLDAELLEVLNQIPAAIEKAFTAFVERHPGHGNQKTHGNRFGDGQAKESLRRLKNDKGAREAYKESHRKRGSGEQARAKEVLGVTGQPADRGFMGNDSSFDEFIQSQKDIFGEDRVTHTKGKRGELFETGGSAYIRLDDRIVSANSGFYTKRLFEKIQDDKGYKEWLDKSRDLARVLGKLK